MSIYPFSRRSPAPALDKRINSCDNSRHYFDDIRERELSNGGEMSSKPLVSCIVIFLNEERFIREAIDSVFAQTCDDWELLLVDDGSTDGSTQIALQYAEQYPAKVRYLEHPGHQNRGASAARNLGLGNAKGEYIAFLDADDVWVPHKLQQQVMILKSHPEATVLYGNTRYWNSWTGNPKDEQRDRVPELVVQSDTLIKPPTHLVLSYPLGKGAAPSLSNLMLRREVIERTGGFEESFKRVYTDQAFLSKVYLKEPVFVAAESEYWDKYRRHPDSCVTVMHKTGQYFSVRQQYLNWLEEYLSKQGFEGPEVWKLLREAQLKTSNGHLQARNKQLTEIHGKQLKELEGALEEERQKVRRLRRRNRRLTLAVQNRDQQLQNIRASRIWGLLQRVDYIKAKLLRR
jgi:glycosyltransferase involved in cell wall biosynthesis